MACSTALDPSDGAGSLPPQAASIAAAVSAAKLGTSLRNAFTLSLS
jgi:hypothetical protein